MVPQQSVTPHNEVSYLKKIAVWIWIQINGILIVKIISNNESICLDSKKVAITIIKAVVTTASYIDDDDGDDDDDNNNNNNKGNNCHIIIIISKWYWQQ